MIKIVSSIFCFESPMRRMPCFIDFQRRFNESLKTRMVKW